MKKLFAIIALVFAFGTSAYAQQDILKSSASYPCFFLMIDSSDHVSAKTGLSPTVTISKSGAAFGSPAGAVTEISSGWYKVAGNATDANTDGPLLLHATGSGADPTDMVCGTVVEFDPRAATTVQNIVDAVLNEAVSGHTTSGTVSKALIDTLAKTSYLPSATAGAAGGVTIAGSNAATTFATLTSTGAMTVNGTSIVTTIQSVRAVPKSTSLEWAMQFTSSAGAIITSGTPACTRSIDAPASFSSTTNAASAVSSLGISEITLSTTDTAANYYTILRCTLTGARDYYNIFKVQP